jgi:hypothetical protein
VTRVLDVADSARGEESGEFHGRLLGASVSLIAVDALPGAAKKGSSPQCAASRLMLPLGPGGLVRGMSKHRAQDTNRLPLVDGGHEADPAAGSPDRTLATGHTSNGGLPVELTFLPHDATLQHRLPSVTATVTKPSGE